MAELANLAGTTPTQPNFVTELPAAIDYGEQRIFTDLDLIATITSDVSQSCTPGLRVVPVPGTFVVVQAVNIRTPVGAPAKLNQCVRASQDLLDYLFPDATITGIPYRFCVQTQGFGANPGVCVFGPWPDQAYQVQFIGTQRPAPISVTNQSTFLSTNLPHLFLTACMIHMSAYQKNWSALGSDPQSGSTYESQYKALLKGCAAEELRKRYEGSSSFPPWGFDVQPTSPEQQ